MNKLEESNSLAREFFFAGTAALIAHGIHSIREGYVQKNTSKIIQGLLETTTGSFVISMGSMDHQTVKVVNQVTLLLSAGYFFIYSGISDLNQRKNSLTGVSKILLSIGSIAATTYYLFYHAPKQIELIDTSPALLTDEKVPEQIRGFLQKHQPEITRIIKEKKPVQEWTYLGHGLDKMTFEHPDFPGNILKINRWRHDCLLSNGGVQQQYQGLKQTIKVVQQQGFNYIKLPYSFLFHDDDGKPFLIEEKLTLEPMPLNALQKEYASIKELAILKEITGLCDLSLDQARNAGVLEGSPENDPTIGIYDFDCIKPALLKRAKFLHCSSHNLRASNA